ncbi:hypothetical protein Peternella1_43 [Winogradskyella phage Peternella_1]|uniref:Uncharacterized protein n=1 Tax=Winogradskyella phage Peternella_1 TaxID=2745699 RepID=A0A8E4ZMC1_9CAUD|nr:hypothetical protein M1M32_gp43 [Winogradskyella phage Peternella_1]QQV91579.1 hypothetical protein Peternella1_43 [Winogradskyella phage Peternella_1]
MSKILGKSQLQEKADKLFKDYPDAKEGFVTNDGNAFLDQNRADLHAKTSDKLKVITFENETFGAATSEKTIKPASADQLIELAKTATAEDAQIQLDIENEGKQRKTVIAAFEARITELNAAE